MGILDTTSEATKQTDIDEILGFLASLEKVLPTEKDMKENLIENRVYNEYNVEELQASFGYVSDLLCQVWWKCSRVFLPSDQLVASFGRAVSRRDAPSRNSTCA